MATPLVQPELHTSGAMATPLVSPVLGDLLDDSVSAGARAMAPRPSELPVHRVNFSDSVSVS